jgi:16S rRNA (adenine1518-N6/adenine1519-N6)-dimethyltransferase
METRVTELRVTELRRLGVTGAQPLGDGLLSGTDVRALVDRLGLRPTKSKGQNFVLDPNSVRRLVRLAAPGPGETVLEVGPGLGSLTLGLLPAADHVVAVELDPVLADALADTVQTRLPDEAGKLTVVTGDALRVEVPGEPSVLAANLPYNVAVPIVLRLLEHLPSLRRGLVMVQAEVAERLTAGPGSRIYGVPSVKLAWYASSRIAGMVSRTVFWPQPNVDSALVAFERRDPPEGADRLATFAAVDAAFAQRRKTLRAALSGWAGSAAEAETRLRAAGIDPGARGEALTLAEFARLAG